MAIEVFELDGSSEGLVHNYEKDDKVEECDYEEMDPGSRGSSEKIQRG